jgi:serine phosphatase RsbU (regulator of sigma subunit)
VPESGSLKLLLATEDESLAGDIRRAGHKVVQCIDGFDTIRRAIESKPDAIILDKVQTGLPAQTIALWLKLNPSTQDLPVIGLSEEGNGWAESQVDVHFARSEAVERLSDVTGNLIEAASRHSDGDLADENGEFDPLSVTLDLIEIYRERLGLAGAMIQLASLQHDLGDFSYTIKSILEAAGHALQTPLVGLTVLREQTSYVLVRDHTLTRAHVNELEKFTGERLEEYLDKQPQIEDQLIFGRRRLATRSDLKASDCRFFGHPVYSRGKILGYLTGLYPEQEPDEVFCRGLLPDLTAQIALLIVNSDLITAHEKYVTELSNILRAAIETASISPLSETSSKSFLLQFLLIVLELCHTDRGCVILLDDDGYSIGNVAALGCEEQDVIEAPLKDKVKVSEGISALAPGEVIIDTIRLGTNRTTRLITPLVAGDKTIGGLVVMGFLRSLSPRLIEALKTLCSLAGYFIHNRALYQRSIKSSIIDDQLKIARDVQREMLPETHPEIPGYDIFGQSVPAREVGGDFYDYIPKGDSMNIAIADVCGKSIPASLLMTMTRALFVSACEHSEGPDEVLMHVNSHMAQRIGKGQFVTASLMKIDKDRIIYSSAGHQPLLVYRAARNDFEEIDADGIAMGIVDSIDFERVETRLEPGDIALMFTDGLNEAMNPHRVQFGYDNIRSVIRRFAKKSSMEIVFELFDAIRDHADGTAQFDDTTTVVIKRTDEGVGENANNSKNHKEEED